MREIAITIDTDWAPDFVIDQMAEQIVASSVAATWFITHDSAATRRLKEEPLFEVGLHPNFGPGSSHGATPTEVIAYCNDLCPDATSFRTHGLVQSTNLIGQILAQSSLRIDSSLFLPGARNLEPVQHLWQGEILTRLPYFWEDDFYYQDENVDWDPEAWVLAPGLKVFDFHPIHFLLNSRTDLPYRLLKKRCPSLQDLQMDDYEWLVNDRDGSRTFLERLIRLCRGSEFTTLRDLVATEPTWGPSIGRAEP